MTMKLDFVGDGWHYTYFGSAHNVFTRLAAQLDNGNIELPTQVVVSIERNSERPSGDDRSDIGDGALLAEKEDDSAAGSGQRLDTGSSEAHRAVVPQEGAESQAGPSWIDIDIGDYVHLSAKTDDGKTLNVTGQVKGTNKVLDSRGDLQYGLWVVSPGKYNGWFGAPLWTLEESSTQPFKENDE